VAPRRAHSGNDICDEPRPIPVGPGECPIHVAAARLRAARPGDPCVRFVSGWGTSATAARRNCLLEAAERYAGQFFGSEPLRRARACELDNLAVTPDDILLVSNRQYETRRRWNRRHPGLNSLPERWSRARSQLPTGVPAGGAVPAGS
jgi:YcaO cyclodehydratase, ATP-ad Mg2+-binding